MEQFNQLNTKYKVYGNNVVESYDKVKNVVNPIHDKLKIDKAYILLVLVLAPIILFSVFGFGNFILDAVFFGYPLYISMKAIESSDKEDDTTMLTYWLIFSLVKLLESMFGWLIALIPFYYFIKIGLFLWCLNSNFRGANVVYRSVIKPFIVPKLNELLGITPSKVGSSSSGSTKVLTVFISSVLLARDYNDVMCEISIEREEKKSNSTKYKSKYMEGKDLHYNFDVRIPAITEESFNNDWLHISIKTDPTFDNQSEKMTIGEVKYKLSEIEKLQSKNGEFNLTDCVVDVSGKLTIS